MWQQLDDYMSCVLGGSTHAGGYYNDTQLVSKGSQPNP